MLWAEGDDTGKYSAVKIDNIRGFDVRKIDQEGYPIEDYTGETQKLDVHNVFSFNSFFRFDKIYNFVIFRAWVIQKCMLAFAQTPAKLGSH